MGRLVVKRLVRYLAAWQLMLKSSEASGCYGSLANFKIGQIAQVAYIVHAVVSDWCAGQCQRFELMKVTDLADRLIGDLRVREAQVLKAYQSPQRSCRLIGNSRASDIENF